MKCPICRGLGKLEEPINQEIDFKKKATIILHKNKFGIRQIQRLLGYKSPRSITKILENNK